MKRNYDECVTKYSDSFVRVVLDPGYVSRIQNFVTELVEAKSKEDHHKIDSNKEVKRFTTGFLGEAALEKLFGIPIIDWTIGYSGLYHIPGYRVGIKTCLLYTSILNPPSPANKSMNEYPANDFFSIVII